MGDEWVGEVRFGIRLYNRKTTWYVGIPIIREEIEKNSDIYELLLGKADIACLMMRDQIEHTRDKEADE